MSYLKKLGKGFRGALNAVKSDEFEINNEKIKCVHCAHEHFESGEAQLNNAFLIFVNLDWANKRASILVCKKCSYIMWFGKPPKKIIS